MPPAAPWITRPATSSARLPATAQTTVPAANVPRLARIMRLLPAPPPSRPITGVRMLALSRYAVEIQAAPSALVPRLAWIFGRAGMTSDCIIAKTVPANASTAISTLARTGAVLAGALAGARLTGRVTSGAGAFTTGLRGGSGCFVTHPRGSIDGRVTPACPPLDSPLDGGLRLLL